MKPLVYCLLAASGCLILSHASAQQGRSAVDVSPLADSLSLVYNVVRTIPDGFHFQHGEIYIWKIGDSWIRYRKDDPWKKSGKTGAVGVLLQSDDRQCEVLYDHPNGNPLIDRYPKALPGFYSEHNLFHRNAITSNLLTISQGRGDIRFEDYVTVISGREARRRFNADSVFLFDVPIEPLAQDGEVYTHCTRIYLSKKDRPYLGFVWFFTDEGAKSKQQYISRLDGHVRYKKGRWHVPAEWSISPDVKGIKQ